MGDEGYGIFDGVKKGKHLLVDLGEEPVEIIVNGLKDDIKENGDTHSWSLKREYSSSPTLMGLPPYCNHKSAPTSTIFH